MRQDLVRFWRGKVPKNEMKISVLLDVKFFCIYLFIACFWRKNGCRNALVLFWLKENMSGKRMNVDLLWGSSEKVELNVTCTFSNQFRPKNYCIFWFCYNLRVKIVSGNQTNLNRFSPFWNLRKWACKNHPNIQLVEKFSSLFPSKAKKEKPNE